ncbi:Uncharacterised protein [Bordetella pertussis]|nr:Uncharacterised protein [Bordetella pertussis]CFU04604.1 Uncharacterised protein [Bordetella pertussis]CFW11960.1 Uncharacterised protein [Bordetella pertussis]
MRVPVCPRPSLSRTTGLRRPSRCTASITSQAARSASATASTTRVAGSWNMYSIRSLYETPAELPVLTIWLKPSPSRWA